MPLDKMVPETWTILKLLSWTESYFKSYNIDSPRLTAEILLCHALNIRRLDLYLQFDRPLNKDELAAYKSLIKRRVKREPVAYITGIKGFWDSQFSVTSDVLIPRPDTETLVEAALAQIQQKKESLKRKITVLELGTGSGAIAVSLAKANPDVLFFATDISLKAALVAKNNSVVDADYGVIDSASEADFIEKTRLPNLFFLVGSWFSPINIGAQFDIIVSNPPYIPTDEINNLQQEVQHYEPHLALDGGADGISCLREIMLSAYSYLSQEGILLMEMGFDQYEKLEQESLKIEKYEKPIFIKDYAGHYRVVLLKMKKR